MKRITALLAGIFVGGATVCAAAPTLNADEQAVRAAIVARSMVHGAVTPPKVEHVVVVGAYALAEWVMREAGGEALLRKRSGRWTVITSGGGAMDVATISSYGVPKTVAQRLFAGMQRAWATPSPR